MASATYMPKAPSSNSHQRNVEAARRGAAARKIDKRKKSGLPYKKPILEVDPDFQEKFCQLLKDGNFIATACRALKITRPTYRRWMRLGEDEIEPYAAFYRAVLVAEAECEATMVKDWSTSPDWRAKQNFLARRFPDRWREPAKEVKHDVSGSVQILLPDNGRGDHAQLQSGGDEDGFDENGEPYINGDYQELDDDEAEL